MPFPMVPASGIQLVAFDVDGTLVEHDDSEVIWQVLNRRFIGDSSINQGRYQAYLDGTLTYAQWVELDMSGWRDGGATRISIEAAIREELRLVPFAEHVVHELARRGYVVAIVSGTLDIVLDVLFPDHPFAHVFTNRIRFDEAGGIEGWQATPFDMDGKAEALMLLSQQLSIPTECFAFVGDHLNDRSALALVGMPVAYDPKHDDVRNAARQVIDRGRLDTLLELLPSRI